MNVYWAQRMAKSQEEKTLKNIKEVNEELKKYFSKSLIRLIAQFEATYDKLLLTVGEGRTPTPADLYNLDKYWELQNQLRIELQKLGDKQITFLSKKFMAQYAEIYEGIAIKGDLKFRKADTAAVAQIINQIWCADGKSWSQRIWENTDLLQQTLNDGLVDCVIAGSKTSQLKEILQDRFNVSYSRADALVRTEMAHIQTQAAKQRYEDYGIKEVQVWASKDERRCKVCGQLHLKKYPIGAAVPIPAHTNCRCCIIPVVD